MNAMHLNHLPRVFSVLLRLVTNSVSHVPSDPTPLNKLALNGYFRPSVYLNKVHAARKRIHGHKIVRCHARDSECVWFGNHHRFSVDLDSLYNYRYKLITG